MRVMVSGGRHGAWEAAEAGHVAVIVDALRASATTASLLQYGVKEIVVVEGLEEAWAEARKRPECWIAGERGCVMVDGFDMGNSPLQAAPERPLPETVVFSSSNMSRCCVGAATCPAAFLGTLPTLSACAEKALRAAEELGRDITLIPAGAVVDEYKLVLEDYVAAGALLEKLVAGGADAEGDAAQAAADLYEAAQEQGLELAFLGSDNGRLLTGLVLEEDVRFACRVDVLQTVPKVVKTYEVEGGGTAAVLRAG